MKKVSGPHIQPRRPGIPRHVRYQNDTSVFKVVTLRQLHPVFNVVKLSTALEDPIPGRKLQALPSC